MHRGQQQDDRLKLGKALDAVNNNKNYKRYEEIIESRDDEIKTLEQKCKAYEKENRNLHKSVQQHEDDQIKREKADKELLDERVVMQTKMDSQDDEHRLRVEEVEKTWKQNLADATAKDQRDNSQHQADKSRWEETVLEGERQHKECKVQKEQIEEKHQAKLRASENKTAAALVVGQQSRDSEEELRIKNNYLRDLVTNSNNELKKANIENERLQDIIEEQKNIIKKHEPISRALVKEKEVTANQTLQISNLKKEKKKLDDELAKANESIAFLRKLKETKEDSPQKEMAQTKDQLKQEIERRSEAQKEIVVLQGEKEDLKFKAKDALQKLKQEKTKSKQSEDELQQMKVDLYTSVQLIWDLPSFKKSIIALHKRYCDDKTCEVVHQDSSTAEALRKAVWDTHNMVEVEKMNKKKEIKEMILKMEDNDKRTSEHLKTINEARICALEQHQKPKHSMELPKQIPSDANETIKAPQAETSSLEEQLQKPEEPARKEKLPKKTLVQKCIGPIRDSCHYVRDSWNSFGHLKRRRQTCPEAVVPELIISALKTPVKVEELPEPSSSDQPLTSGETYRTTRIHVQPCDNKKQRCNFTVKR